MRKKSMHKLINIQKCFSASGPTSNKSLFFVFSSSTALDFVSFRSSGSIEWNGKKLPKCCWTFWRRWNPCLVCFIVFSFFILSIFVVFVVYSKCVERREMDQMGSLSLSMVNRVDIHIQCLLVPIRSVMSCVNIYFIDQEKCCKMSTTEKVGFNSNSKIQKRQLDTVFSR